jgi:hypothetical protein
MERKANQIVAYPDRSFTNSFFLLSTETTGWDQAVFELRCIVDSLSWSGLHAWRAMCEITGPAFVSACR